MLTHLQYINLIECITDHSTNISEYKFKCNKCKKIWNIIYNENTQKFIKKIHPSIFIYESCIYIT